jgi:hypothetical protein
MKNQLLFTVLLSATIASAALAYKIDVDYFDDLQNQSQHQMRRSGQAAPSTQGTSYREAGEAPPSTQGTSYREAGEAAPSTTGLL